MTARMIRVAILMILAATGHMAAGPAFGAWAAVAAALVVMVRSHLGDLDALARWIRSLALGDESGPPPGREDTTLAETVAARLGRLLLELAHQIGEHLEDGGFRFPLLLTHEEMASMACTTRETVTRTLGQFRKDGWISIEDSLVRIALPSAPT